MRQGNTKTMPDIPEGFTFEDDPSWYKDAIIYEVHVRAFYDSNEDGIGDFTISRTTPAYTRLTERSRTSKSSSGRPTGEASASLPSWC